MVLSLDANVARTLIARQGYAAESSAIVAQYMGNNTDPVAAAAAQVTRALQWTSLATSPLNQNPASHAESPGNSIAIAASALHAAREIIAAYQGGGAPSPVKYVVKPGQNLSSIAKEVTGDGGYASYMKIYNDNRASFGTRNENQLQIGQTLWIQRPGRAAYDFTMVNASLAGAAAQFALAVKGSMQPWEQMQLAGEFRTLGL